MNDYITTFSKTHFTPTDPKPEDIHIEDIAHALSMMARANGHFPEFYSVGQHSVSCCEEAAARGYTKRVQLACLLHDASEAYLADITRPVKRCLPKYKAIEQVLQDRIFRKYLGEVSEEETRLWRRLDDVMLFHEFEHFMGERLWESEEPLQSSPCYETEGFKRTEERFLAWFRKLEGETHGAD
ncbi:MAG: HD domain-containing protein [Eubacteriales bacterium]|nr:HD domain-containing protein [Eubacteriales bacterium]